MREVKDLPALSGGGRLGHIDEFKTDRLHFFMRLARECGDMGTFRIYFRPIVFVNTPNLVHEVLVEKARAFEKAMAIRVALHPLAGEGLFTSEGELWKRQRKLMSPLFHQRQILDYARAMTECAHRGVDTWRDGERVDVAREMVRMTMSVVGKTLFDADTFDEADELGEALTVALEWSNARAATPILVAQLTAMGLLRESRERLPAALRPAIDALLARMRAPLLLPIAGDRRLRRAVTTLDARIQRMIDDRRRVGLQREDLLTRLLRARDEEGARMSDKQVRDEAITLFVAGHETTATGLAWSFYELARHPEIYAKVRREGDALGGRAPGWDDLPNLAYSLKVFKEALRLYPPVYVFSRQAIEDVEIGGCRLPRGTVVFVSPYTLHRREELYPDPERFDPERFEPAAEEARPRLSWLPFGGGPRICIGNHFALLEGQTLLATIARRATFELEPGHTVRPQPHSTLRPEGGMPMIVRLRASSQERCAGKPAVAPPVFVYKHGP